MKKILIIFITVLTLSACGTAYNTALKQVELGMTKQEVTGLMGEKYYTTGVQDMGNKQTETIEYIDRYKYHWLFTFENNHLTKWWKESE